MKFITAVLSLHFAFAVCADHCPEIRLKQKEFYPSDRIIIVPEGWKGNRRPDIKSWESLKLVEVEAKGSEKSKHINCHYKIGSRQEPLILSSEKKYELTEGEPKWHQKADDSHLCWPKKSKSDCKFGSAKKGL